MSERKTRASRPPSDQRSTHTGSLTVVAGAPKGAKVRRGRPSQDDYARAVAAVLRDSPYELEQCAQLAQLPGVRDMARRLQRAVFPTGLALRTLLDRAAHEVEMLSRAQRDAMSQRVAVFLDIWLRQHGTVVGVADALGLSRSYVAHKVQPCAIDLVARRFLELAWRVEVPA